MLTKEEEQKVDQGKLPKKGFLIDSVQVWDERELTWFVGWEGRFKRQIIKTFFTKKALITTDAYVSESFYCAPYQNALVEIYIPDTTGTPTDLLIDAEFSDDGVTWFKYMDVYWGDLRWEDVGAPYSESVPLRILAQFIRFKATSQGASAQAYFTLSLKVIFNS